jgi:ADP-ribose pyrophosphatase YjhB (NUDIX family)
MKPRTDRLAVLAKIRRTVGDRSDQGKVKQTLVFCIEDGERLPDAKFWQVRYTHGDHTHDRAFVFYPTTKWEFRDDGELRHFSVGAILWRQYDDERERRYCLFRRRTHPIGYYTIPAGHLEMGEDPQVAALREAYEETQLGVLSAELLYEEEVRDECRRGADYHFWHLYLCQCTGEPRMSDEGDVIGWFTRDEITGELPLTRPTGYFLGQLFGETPRNARER